MFFPFTLRSEFKLPKPIEENRFQEIALKAAEKFDLVQLGGTGRELIFQKKFTLRSRINQGGTVRLRLRENKVEFVATNSLYSLISLEFQ